MTEDKTDFEKVSNFGNLYLHEPKADAGVFSRSSKLSEDKSDTSKKSSFKMPFIPK